MPTWKVAERPKKAKVRELYVDQSAFLDKPLNCMISLVGEDCECLNYQIERGLVKPNTRVLACERDPNLFGTIEAQLRQLRLQNKIGEFYLHRGSLTDFPLYQHELVDFVNLDFFAEPTPDTSFAISHVSKRLKVGSEVVITSSINDRGHVPAAIGVKFPAWCRKQLFGEYYDLCVDSLTRAVYTNKVDIGDATPNGRTIANDCHLISVMSMWDWDLELVGGMAYRDTMSMLHLHYRVKERLPNTESYKRRQLFGKVRADYVSQLGRN